MSKLEKKTSLGAQPRKPPKRAPVKKSVASKTSLNALRDEMRGAVRGLGSLYFEARVTLGMLLLTEKQTDAVYRIASLHEFRFEESDLIFCSSKLERVKSQVEELAEALKIDGYKVWRYRIGEVMMDSNNWDSLSLL